MKTKKIQIPYNQNFYELRIPENNIAELISTIGTSVAQHNEAYLSKVVEEFESINDQIKSKRILIIFEDCTRDAPYEDKIKP